jgi:hypothetical protein
MRRAVFCAATRRRVSGDNGAQAFEKLGQLCSSPQPRLEQMNWSRPAHHAPGNSGGLQ